MYDPIQVYYALSLLTLAWDQIRAFKHDYMIIFLLLFSSINFFLAQVNDFIENDLMVVLP